MSHQPLIDGFEFATAGARQQGRWPVRELPRLRDMLASDAGEIAYTLEGTRDERGRPGLRLRLEGTLLLRCQRCLEPMPFAVRADELLVLAASQAEIDAEPPDAHAPDRVLAGKKMPLAELIEEQLILELPYTPRHEGCAAGAAPPEAGRVSPFAGLRGLMRSKH
ncbi:MAG: YceD family protein [Betaproteobacteria bacterium]